MTANYMVEKQWKEDGRIQKLSQCEITLSSRDRRCCKIFGALINETATKSGLPKEIIELVERGRLICYSKDKIFHQVTKCTQAFLHSTKQKRAKVMFVIVKCVNSSGSCRPTSTSRLVYGHFVPNNEQIVISLFHWIKERVYEKIFRLKRNNFFHWERNNSIPRGCLSFLVKAVRRTSV